MDADHYINFNIKAYNKMHDKYDKVHTEIFNSVEQDRLHAKLTYAAGLVRTEPRIKKALDYGCGTGNVTGHLIDLGFYVISADTSEKCLLHAKKKYESTEKLELLKINGRDLSNIEDDSLDLAVSYSVLHHVPDYLRIIREMIRVLKRGAVIYLDHEYSGSYWEGGDEYKEFIRLATPRKKLRRFFKWANYVINARKMLNPRYHTEGDIHLWPDDHIEWDKIRQLLNTRGCEILCEEDYLLYDSKYPFEVYQEYKDKCGNMHLLIGIKK